MNKKQEYHVIDILFVIALLCIFALSSFFLISIGASIYSKTVTNMESNFNGRTAFAYITEKVRQSDATGLVSVSKLDDIPALAITQEISGVSYITYLYQYEGHLKELTIRKDTPLPASAGQNIIPLSDFSLTHKNDHLLIFSFITADSESFDLYISTKSEGGLSDEK
ncbi:MAG: DUF4860 domain-containing protein [Lachnospiraceae bacterium]|nr:DUF4860 domain-containing protein [Lachnospiraceae bacterium]